MIFRDVIVVCTENQTENKYFYFNAMHLFSLYNMFRPVSGRMTRTPMEKYTEVIMIAEKIHYQ
jgi:hypothetical protein